MKHRSRSDKPPALSAGPATATLLSALLMACASAPASRPAASTPGADAAGHDDGVQQEVYPGRCALLGVELGSREGDLRTDAIVLVARYQAGEGRLPFGLSFEVQQEREDDLRAHLEQNRSVLCAPEISQEPSQEPSPPAPYRVELPPFEGQSGRYLQSDPGPAAP